ncbi:MAG: hypothetical protein ACLP0J_09390 [Solirubrobacteraceae bacterium]
MDTALEVEAMGRETTARGDGLVSVALPTRREDVGVGVRGRGLVAAGCV